jgi:hypothetical protein
MLSVVYAECRIFSVVVLIAIMLNGVMLSVMVPYNVYITFAIPTPYSQHHI